MCVIQVLSFGPTEENPRNMGTWTIDIQADNNTLLFDFVSSIPIYWGNISLKLIVDAIVKKEDLTAGCFLLNGQRIIDFEVLKKTVLQNGDVVSVLPQLIAG